MRSVTVRDATEADAAPMAALCGQLGYPSTADAVRRRFERLRPDGNLRMLVAVQGDAEENGEGGENGEGETIVGLATVHLRFTINHDTPIGQLTMLVVDEKRRTRGVGRALVETAEAWARDRGCRRFVVTTALRRADAHAFYERLDYTHTGRRYGKDLS